MNYIIFGELYPLIRKNLNKILKDHLGKVDDFNVAKIDFDESSLEEIEYESSSLPLGYEKKAVVVENATFLTKDVTEKDEKKVLDILQNSSEDIALVFILRNLSVNKNGKIYKFIEESGRILEIMNISKEEWPIYIRKYFKNKNITITSEAINELALRVEGDLTRFLNEADKLSLYKSSISLADVQLMISKPLEDDAFQMSNALFRGDNSAAIAIYRDLKKLGQKFVETLIPMLASQFRFISDVCFLDTNGLEIDEIAKELNVSSIRVKMALKNSRNISRRQIAGALDKLYFLDLQIKSGQIDRSYGLELFLINFPN